MNNSAFWRAIHSLTHPLSILAVLLLLFNDHYLRHVSPSWITGKLGDFTWLIFAPFIAGLLFAWLIPRRLQQHERVVGIASIGFIGLWFATAKTIPLVHEWTTNTLDYIVGWEGSLRLDASDLITLPALLISWHIWRHAPNTAPNFKAYAPIIFGLAIMGTLASSLTDEAYYLHGYQGINSIDLIEGSIFVNYRDQSSPSNTYRSDDGGLTWQRSDTEVRLNGRSESPYHDWELPREDNHTIYRFVLGERIDIFDIDGTTQLDSYDLSQFNFPVREAYYERQESYNSYMIGPLDAAVHPETGNLVMAMSLDGVLVITPEGEYIWATVGDYSYTDLTTYDLLPLVQVNMMSAGLLFLLVISVLIWHQGSSCITFSIQIITWLFWLLVDLFISTDHTAYPAYLYAPLIIVFLIQCRPLLIENRRLLVSAGLLSGVVTLLYLLPYVLWLENRIPSYGTAQTFALLLVLGGTFTSIAHIRNRYYEPTDVRGLLFQRRKSTHQIDHTVDPFEPE